MTTPETRDMSIAELPPPVELSIDSVAAATAGFLRSLDLKPDAILRNGWVSLAAFSTCGYIDIHGPYGDPTARLESLRVIAAGLGLGPDALVYIPHADGDHATVRVTGDWAECPIHASTLVRITDLVDIETARAIADTTELRSEYTDAGSAIAWVSPTAEPDGVSLAESSALDRAMCARADDLADQCAERADA